MRLRHYTALLFASVLALVGCGGGPQPDEVIELTSLQGEITANVGDASWNTSQLNVIGKKANGGTVYVTSECTFTIPMAIPATGGSGVTSVTAAYKNLTITNPSVSYKVTQPHVANCVDNLIKKLVEPSGITLNLPDAPDASDWDAYLLYDSSYDIYYVTACCEDNGKVGKDSMEDKFKAECVAKGWKCTNDSDYTYEDCGYYYANKAGDDYDFEFNFCTDEGFFWLELVDYTYSYNGDELDKNLDSLPWYWHYVNEYEMVHSNTWFTAEFVNESIGTKLVSFLELQLPSSGYVYGVYDANEEEEDYTDLFLAPKLDAAGNESVYYIEAIFNEDNTRSLAEQYSTGGYEVSHTEETGYTITEDWEILEYTYDDYKVVDPSGEVFIEFDNQYDTTTMFIERLSDFYVNTLTDNTDWTSAEKNMMNQAIGEVLPFVRLGSDYKLEYDEEYEDYVISDTYYKSLVTEYGKELVKAGYTQDPLTGEYSKEDGKYVILVNITYYEGNIISFAKMKLGTKDNPLTITEVMDIAKPQLKEEYDITALPYYFEGYVTEVGTKEVDEDNVWYSGVVISDGTTDLLVDGALLTNDADIKELKEYDFLTIQGYLCLYEGEIITAYFYDDYYDYPCLIMGYKERDMELKRIVLDQHNVTLPIEGTTTLVAAKDPIYAVEEISWEVTDDENHIATVTNGFVEVSAEAKAGDTFSVQAYTFKEGSLERVFDQCDFTVTDRVEPTAISLNKTTLDLAPGETSKLVATTTPSQVSGKVTWESSNTEVATVENGVVTVKNTANPGQTVTITAKIAELSASCTVTVKNTIVEEELTATKLGVEAGSTSYGEHTYVSQTTGVTYKANCAGSIGIQIRSKNSNSGIIAGNGTAVCSKVTVTLDASSNKDGIKIFGSNTAFTYADMFGTSSLTLIGTLTQSGTVTSASGFKYIGICSAGGANYLTSIVYSWQA